MGLPGSHSVRNQVPSNSQKKTLMLTLSTTDWGRQVLVPAW